MNSKTLLIADAGGSSTDWRLVQNGEIASFKTNGFNPQTHDIQLFISEIQKLGAIKVDEIHLYIAGAETIQQKQFVTDSLESVFGIKPSVEHDLLAVGRALYGKETGYACILGTGSNVGYYDGEKIEEVGACLGYVVGDEGSGAYLGKQLLKARYRGLLTNELVTAFDEYFQWSQAEILERIYHTKQPNQFLASFAPFLKEYESYPLVKELIKGAFTDFFQAYFQTNSIDHSLSFVGSIAFHFQELLQEVGEHLGYQIKNISQSPIEGLLNYHLS